MIDSEFIRNFCSEHFPDGRLASDGTELVIQSIFVKDDYKRHQSINLETGLWQCFKSGNKGNFLRLYSEVTGLSYRNAYEKFMFDAFIDGRENSEEVIESTGEIDPNDLINFCMLDTTQVYNSTPEGLLMAMASEFVYSRGLQDNEFFVAHEGEYKERLIIPYTDVKNRIFFFQARALTGREPKYLNCKSIKSSWILYPYDYDSKGPLYITEGAFDCMALRRLGVNATSTLSCQVSNVQMEQLRHYRGPLVAAFDRDEAGIKGMETFLRMTNKYKISPCYFVFPPLGFKDWNELCIKQGGEKVMNFLLNKEVLDKVSVALTEL